MRYIIFILASIYGFPAAADGIAFSKGRYPSGSVSVFKATLEQIAFIDLFRKCRPDNAYSPYVFRLTAEQSAKLKKATGLVPSRFALVEGFRGDTGDELKINVINRFTESEFEVLHSGVTSDKDAEHWERQVMGWKSNPFQKVNAGQAKAGTCPK